MPQTKIARPVSQRERVSRFLLLSTRAGDSIVRDHTLWRRSSTLPPAQNTTTHNARIRKVVISSFPPSSPAQATRLLLGCRSVGRKFEEGTLAAWLHDLLKPHVNRVVVCDSRKAALLRDGNKSDRIDARNLSELLRTNQLKPVYHGKHGLRTLKCTREATTQPRAHHRAPSEPQPQC